MDIKEIKQIIDLMKRSELTEFEIEENEFKLRICRSAGEGSSSSRCQSQPPFSIEHQSMPLMTHPMPPHPSSPAAATQQAPAPQTDEPGEYITSPMVGTFYRAASPENPPFVEKNTTVESNTVVCIIEAMKVMNEIQAEIKGTILEVLVENGQPVEFGQPLFKVKKS